MPDPGRPPVDRARRPLTAAERQARRRRKLAALSDLPEDQWTEAVCLFMLQDPITRKYPDVGRKVWLRLGVLRGFDVDAC